MKMEFKNETFPIKGMHCSKCVSVIERTLMEIGGVRGGNCKSFKKAS